jgi:hypothetical protein
MRRITDRLYQVTDAAGTERLVRGVDALEIQGVAENKNTQTDVIAQANAMAEYQEEKAQAEAEMLKSGNSAPLTTKGEPIIEPMVEGTTTTPQTLLRYADSGFPKNDELFRESQNNPPSESSSAPSGGQDAKTLATQSRSELDKTAKKLGIDTSQHSNKTELAEAIFQAQQGE